MAPETVTVTTDENGYFMYEFAQRTMVEVQPKKANCFTPTVSEQLITPRRFHFTGEAVTVWLAHARDDAIYLRSPDGSLSHLIADYPAWSPFDDIVYSRRRTDGFQPALNPARLYITSPAGSPGQPVTQSSADAGEHRQHPDWSPDGDLIVYASTSTRGGTPHGIYTIRPDGTDRSSRIDDGMYPVFAPDGNRIAYEKDGAVYIHDLSTNSGYRLVDNAGRPAWSPDGRYVAFVEMGPSTRLTIKA